MSDKPRKLLFLVLDTPADWLGISEQADMTVLTHLINCINKDRHDTNVWPGNEKLAKRTATSVQTVRRAKLRLNQLGLITMKRHRGKSNIVTVNEDMIRQLADPKYQASLCAEPVDNSPDPYHDGRGSETDPCHDGRGTPATVAHDPCHGGTRTTNRTTNPNRYISPLGGSAISEMVGAPGQRQMALHGIVNSLGEAMRATGPPRQRSAGEAARSEADQASGDSPGKRVARRK